MRAVGPRPDVVIGVALFFLYSIALTDLLRREIKRRHWLDEISFGVVAKLFGIGAALAAVQTGLLATLRGGREVEISRRQSASLRELLSL